MWLGGCCDRSPYGRILGLICKLHVLSHSDLTDLSVFALERSCVWSIVSVACVQKLIRWYIYKSMESFTMSMANKIHVAWKVVSASVLERTTELDLRFQSVIISLVISYHWNSLRRQFTASDLMYLFPYNPRIVPWSFLNIIYQCICISYGGNTLTHWCLLHAM